MARLHPVLWLNRLLAHPCFIVAINIVFGTMVWLHLSEEKLDLSMSWVTMLMDQIIISAGWLIVRTQLKHRKEDRIILLKMSRQVEGLHKRFGGAAE